MAAINFKGEGGKNVVYSQSFSGHGGCFVISENVSTNFAVISGPALEVVAELGHRAFLPCSLSSPQVFKKISFPFQCSIYFGHLDINI